MKQIARYLNWKKIDLILDALSPEYYNVIGILKKQLDRIRK